MKRILPFSIILVSLFFLIFVSTADKRGAVFSTVRHDHNNKPILQAVSHREKYCFSNCGTITVFQNYQNGEWQEITDVRHNDTYVFSNKNLRIESEDFSYFWFCSKFGVTLNGGRDWKIWEANRDDSIKNSLLYGLIENVTIEPTGKGKMFFYKGEKNLNETLNLETEDFGETWHQK